MPMSVYLYAYKHKKYASSTAGDSNGNYAYKVKFNITRLWRICVYVRVFVCVWAHAIVGFEGNQLKSTHQSNYV